MSAPALICRLAKDSVSHMVKIGNGVSRNMNLEFLHASTTVIASPHHHLITSARSAPHLALTAAAINCVKRGRKHQVVLSARAF
jgi:hypothetical protein